MSRIEQYSLVNWRITKTEARGPNLMATLECGHTKLIRTSATGGRAYCLECRPLEATLPEGRIP